MNSVNVITSRYYSGLVSNSNRNFRFSNRLTASIITRCTRRNYFNIKKQYPDYVGFVDPILLSKFRDGNEAHEELEKVLSIANLPLVQSEFYVYCGTIPARVDAQTDIPGLGLVNIEFKTMASSSFRKFDNYGIDAFPSYFAQCQVIVGSEPKLPLYFFCKDKNSSAFKDILVSRDSSFIDKLNNIKQEFDLCVRSDTIPKREFEYTSDVCKSCEYYLKCWFSVLMNQCVTAFDFTIEERKIIEHYLDRIDSLRDSYSEYLNLDATLKDFIAYLHNKYSADKLNFKDMIISKVVTRSHEECDDLYVKSILTPEEVEEAYKIKTSKYFKTTIRG